MTGNENDAVERTKAGELDLDALMDAYGIADEESGHAAAVAACEQILTLARTVLPPDGATFAHIVILGFVARAQSLHEAVISSVQANNPHAAFTLLRAYAEQCAAVLYMTDNPGKSKPLEGGEGYGPSIGVITNYAQNSQRMPNFREIYHRLSQYAHPSAAGHFASVQVGSDNSFSWQSAPRFKRDEEKLIAYGWCIEFAHAINTFGFEFAAARRLGSFVPADHVHAWPHGRPPWSAV
ncbi:hypothetical protein ACQE98_15960 [Ornithinimicrobium sp. W1679]|uniref:hypothetical protein n=1 Tax=Ornithinimicrobium sp. W1679 TaxID=3418770 RepID=UPI003CF944BD